MYSLIIVDYNTLDTTVEYLSRCRQALGRQGASHVVIVENGDDTAVPERLRDAWGECTRQPLPGTDLPLLRFCRDGWEVCYCHSGENMGYARGNNLGVRIADALWNDPYYIISNNDLVFPEQADLQAIHRYFQQHPRVALVGPKIVGTDGRPQSPRRKRSAFCMLIGWYWAMALGGPFKRLVDDVVTDAREGQCDWVTGSFLFLRGEGFRQAHGFDPHTFLYAEELILSARLDAAGYTAAYCPAFTLVHAHGQTVQKTISVLRNLLIGFTSLSYYYGTYRGAPDLLLWFAKQNFKIYTGIYRIKQRIKGFFRR